MKYQYTMCSYFNAKTEIQIARIAFKMLNEVVEIFIFNYRLTIFRQ
jgi:hypothetical protein